MFLRFIFATEFENYSLYNLAKEFIYIVLDCDLQMYFTEINKGLEVGILCNFIYHYE